MTRKLLLSSITAFIVCSVHAVPPVGELSALGQDIVSAIGGSHSSLVAALEAHKSQLLAGAGTVLKDLAPGVVAAAGGVKLGAEMVEGVAGIIPGGGTIAALAGDIEAGADLVQQATAGGSASSAAKNSPLVQQVLAAEKEIQSGSGTRSRVLAALLCLGSAAALGVKMYSDWFSTNSGSSDENQTQQRVDAYVADIPVIVGLGGAAIASGYYAITNKWFTDQVAAANVGAQATINHVNTHLPAAAAQAKSAAVS